MEYLILIIVVAIIFYFIGKNMRSSRESHANTPVSKMNFKEDRDSWEGGFWEAVDPKTVTAELSIDYIDGNKNNTSREVRVRQFDNELYGGIIMGHCKLRGDTRTFRFDRIKKCIDLETGELIVDFREYINKLYKESPEHSAELLATDYLNVLKVIYFVAKADGQYRKEEKDVISTYVKRLVSDERLDNKMIDTLLKELSIPTMQGFKLAFGKVIKGGEIDPEELAICCNEIVNTQKTIHPMEQEALDYIEKKLIP